MAAPDVPERPALVPDVVLVGQMQGSGFVEDPWLIQRDGRFIQVSELLYRVAEHADGTKTLEQIAQEVTGTTDWAVSADLVRHVIQTKLIPLGLVSAVDGAVRAASAMRPYSPLAVNVRVKVVGPRFIEPLTGVLQFLFLPPVVVAALIAIAAAEAWLFLGDDLGAGLQAAMFMPGFLAITLLVLLVGNVFHEFGHAAALRYGGGKVRGMGAGIYLISPMFYTDVTDCYRLGRRARLRTDLGGVYFHLLFALGIIGLAQLTGQEALLLIVLLVNAQVIAQFIPFARFDGYWILADLTGIPDFFSQMGPFLRSNLPSSRASGSRLPRLKPWVRIVFAAYTFITIPLLVFLLVLMITGLPAFVATSWEALLHQRTEFADARSDGSALIMVGAVLQAIILFVQLVGIAVMLFCLVWTPLHLVWVRARARIARLPRLAPALGIAGVSALLIAFIATPDLPLAGRSAPDGVQRFEIVDRQHVEGTVNYPQVPPVGGNHAPVWQNCGFYEAPIPNERAVHSLEHGAVWIAYRPDLTAEQTDTLRQLVLVDTHLLVSPVPDLPAPVVASAWGRQLRLDSASDPRLDQFVAAYQLGSQAPEPGGPCTGGEGVPS